MFIPAARILFLCMNKVFAAGLLERLAEMRRPYGTKIEITPDGPGVVRF